MNENQKSETLPSGRSDAEPVFISLLNDFLFCPRRAALKAIDGLRSENEFTVLGEIAHKHADFPGIEQRAGWVLLRALPLFSETLNLSGRADLVEVKRASEPADHRSFLAARPIEYKRGRVSRWDNDHVQLCAQALCIEEMFGITVPEGMIFHAQSQKRATVVFDPKLRQSTLLAIDDLRALIARGDIPPPIRPASEMSSADSNHPAVDPRCGGCSLREKCLPELDKGANARAARRLFEISNFKSQISNNHKNQPNLEMYESEI